jgi:hypothetical protein
MTLSEHFNNNEYGHMTDKGTTHDYIDGYYSHEFTPRKNDEIKILEIGIWQGGSLQLWDNWFTNAEITAIEVTKREWMYKPEHIRVINKSGYDEGTVTMFNDDTFDYIIDDGPHTLNSQLYSIRYWLSKVKNGGKLIIEDIQNIDSSKNKFDEICNELEINYDIVDLRENKKRFDDVMIIIQK